MPEAGTTRYSGVAIRIGGEGPRQFLTSGSIEGSGGLPDQPVTVEQDSLSHVLGDLPRAVGTGQFHYKGLDFELAQTAAVLMHLNYGGDVGGVRLTQEYTITNTLDVPIEFDLVRFFDGNLVFDSSEDDDGGGIKETRPNCFNPIPSPTGPQAYRGRSIKALLKSASRDAPYR
ncbi:MAG: hypothetical protein R3C05_28240 [Pirellulaceae bacterium]